MRKTLQKMTALVLGLTMLAGVSSTAAETGNHWYYDTDNQFLFRRITVKDVQTDAEKNTLTFRSTQEEDGSVYMINRETVFEDGKNAAEAVARTLMDGTCKEIEVYIPLWDYYAVNRGKDNETQVVAVAGREMENAGENANDESIAAFAEMKTLVVPEPDMTEPYAVLKAFGILEEEADMNETVSRGEMAQLLINTWHRKNETWTAKPGMAFADVLPEHPYYNAIHVARELNCVAGFGDGTFRPDEAVTAEQAVKLVVAMLGYTPVAEANGGYPVGYIQTSAQIGLTEGFTMKSDAPITRDAAAQLLEKALYIPTMEQTSYKPGAEEYEIMDGTNDNPLIRFIDRYWRY